jgi:hypothetical protein
MDQPISLHGKIAEARGLVDELSFKQQLGQLLAEEQASA